MAQLRCRRLAEAERGFGDVTEVADVLVVLSKAEALPFTFVGLQTKFTGAAGAATGINRASNSRPPHSSGPRNQDRHDNSLRGARHL